MPNLFRVQSSVIVWISLQLMKQLEPADIQLQEEIQDILSKIRNGEAICIEEPKQSSTFIRFLD